MGSATPLVQIDGTQPLTYQHGVPYGEAFGFSVAGGFDIGGPLGALDGVPDLVIGSPLFNVDASIPNAELSLAGRVRAFSVDLNAPLGQEVTPLLVDSPVIDGTVMIGANPGDQFGYSVTCLADIDNDGGPEILGGAWQAAIDIASVCPPLPDPLPRTALGGYAAMYSSGSNPPGAKRAIFYGEKVRDHMGRAVDAENLYGTSSRPEIVLSGLGWSPQGAVSGVNTELGKGFIWDGDMVMLP